MPIARVNQVTGSDYSGVGAATIAAASFALTAGNVVVVGVRFSGGASDHVAITDTAGNSYEQIAQSVGISSSLMALFVCPSADAGHATNVVTATMNRASCTFRGIVVAEYSGFPNRAIKVSNHRIDGHLHTLSGSGPYDITSPAFSTFVADALLIGLAQLDATGGTWTAGSGYTKVIEDASSVLMMEEQIASSLQSGVTVAARQSLSNLKDLVGVALADFDAGGGVGGGLRSFGFVG